MQVDAKSRVSLIKCVCHVNTPLTAQSQFPKKIGSRWCHKGHLFHDYTMPLTAQPATSCFLSLSKHVQTGCKQRAKYKRKGSKVCFLKKIRHALQSAPAGRECSVTRPTHTTADTLDLMEGAADEGCRDKAGRHNDRLLFFFSFFAEMTKRRWHILSRHLIRFVVVC